MFTPKGKFGWYELMTTDTDAAAKFYSDVVGWTTHSMASPDGGPAYTTFNLGEAGIAGMLAVPGHTGWIGYIAVGDVDAHIEKIVEAGGKLLRPAQDVPGMLRFAVMADPTGCCHRRLYPEPLHADARASLIPMTPGTIGWSELYTTDLEAGYSFYNKLFGWEKLSDMDMGPMGKYRIFDQGDHHEMGDGGMMTKPPQVPISCWSFYFNVDSISAAIERVNTGGGMVVHGPSQVPGELWIIQAQDPQGAMFALVSNSK